LTRVPRVMVWYGIQDREVSVPGYPADRDATKFHPLPSGGE
jgi:hypothetical protein